jgi:hypothetical protein
MSVSPDSELRKDPNAELVYEFDWTAWLAASGAGAGTIATSTFTITGPDSVLTKDNASIVSGNLKTRVRVKAGTLGKVYRLTNQIVTNESPPETDERSIYLRIVNQ